MTQASKTSDSTKDVVEVMPANIIDSPGPITGSKDMDQWIRDAAEDGVESSMDAHQRIIAQVLAAESPDVILTPVEAIEARDIVGVPFLLYGFEFNESKYDAGSPFYATLDAGMPPDGKRTPVNCGHKKVIAQLIGLRKFGEWPYHVKFEARGRSEHGTPMLALIKWSAEEEKQFADSQDEPPF